jgi:hypothetical protein
VDQRTILVHDAEALKVFALPLPATKTTRTPPDEAPSPETPKVIPTLVPSQCIIFSSTTPSTFPSPHGDSCALLTLSGSERIVHSLTRASPTEPFVICSTVLPVDDSSINYATFGVLPGARWAGLCDAGCVSAGRVAVDWVRLPHGPEGDPLSTDADGEACRAAQQPRCGGRMVLEWPRPIRDPCFDEAAGRMCFVDDEDGEGSRLVVVDLQ